MFFCIEHRKFSNDNPVLRAYWNNLTLRNAFKGSLDMIVEKLGL